MSTEILKLEKKNAVVPKLRFTEFVGKWEIKKLLTQVNSISSGKIKPSDEGTYFVYGSTGIIGRSNSFSHNGDYILVARVGANAGKINRAKGKFAVTDNTLIVDLKDSISVSFCESFLSRFNLNKLIFGSGQPLITGGLLKAIDLVFPTLPEQQKIASFLSAVDEKIQQLSRKKGLLEQYKKGIMQQLFSGKLRFKDENGKNFADWEEKKLGDLGEFKGGGTPSTEISEYWDGDIPWISSSDLIENDISNINVTRFITEKAVSESATKLIPSNSVLFISRVGVGKLAVSKSSICTSQDFANFIPKQIDSIYLAYYFIENNNLLINYAQGTSIKGFTIIDLKSIKVRFPVLEEQQKIANFLSNIDIKIENTNQEIKQMQDFKKGLLQQMFV